MQTCEITFVYILNVFAYFYDYLILLHNFFQVFDIFLFRINVSVLKFGQEDFTSGWIQPPDKGM